MILLFYSEIHQITSIRNETVVTDCSDLNIDTFPFIATLGMSFIFAVCYFLNGMVVQKIGKRNLLGKNHFR